MKLPVGLLLPLTLFCGAMYAQSPPPSGAYGFLINASFNNSAVDATGVSILGVMNFDGSGSVTGTYAYEVDATGPQAAKTTNGSFTGAYSPNADGPDKLTMALDNGINLTLAVAAGDGGQSLQLAATDFQFPAATCTCNVGRAVFTGIARTAPAGAPNGAYGFLLNNTPNVNATIGVARFDGAGNVVMSATFAGASGSNGQPTDAVSFALTGTYSVNTDGTGTISLAAVPGVSNSQTFAFVSTDAGAGMLMIQTDRAGSGVSWGTARRQ